jgi:S-DNA-T family DNA segregation ATPase FtsK/SpoIIIE
MSTTTYDDPEDRDPNGAEVYDFATGARLAPADDDAPPGAQDAPTGADDFEPDLPEPDTDDQDAADEDDEPIRIFRPVLRQVVYVGAGTRTVARRAWESRTTARHERMMRLAEAHGDHSTVLEWEQRASAFRTERHERRMAMLAAPVHAARAIVFGTLTVFGFLLVLGIILALANHHIHDVIGPLMAAVYTIRWLINLFNLLWRPALAASLAAALVALWRIGRARADLPTWIAAAEEVEADLEIDETTIARALAALRIPAITAYFKDGYPLQYLTTPRTDGRGTHAVFRLPPGVSAEKIAKRRTDLATSLYRSANEVWPNTGAEAGILDLWVADKGALAEGAGEYPLLHDGFTDVFKGVPYGKTLRGEPLMAPIRGRNTIIGGIPEQGKSSSGRVIMLGAALDITCELRIFVPDTNFDFEVFKKRCSRYVMGAEDQHIEAICLGLEELVGDIQVRGEKLVRYGEPEVTRALASKNVGLHPIMAILEEAHLAFNHPTFGKRIADAAVTIDRLGRKRLIHLIVSTQATTGGSVPQGVTTNSANGIAFAVARWQENDALLGQGAYSAGHRATDLIPGTDRGNAVVKGFTASRSVVAQAYFVSVSRGNDQATPVINRSLAELARRGLPVPGTSPVARDETPARDLLADLDAVLRGEPVKTADIPGLLRTLAPDWAPYRNLNGVSLRELLGRRYGIQVPTTKRAYPLDPQAVRDALAARDAAPEDAEPDGE